MFNFAKLAERYGIAQHRNTGGGGGDSGDPITTFLNNPRRYERLENCDGFNYSLTQNYQITSFDKYHSCCGVDTNSTRADMNGTRVDTNSTRADTNGTRAYTNSTRADTNRTRTDTKNTRADTNGMRAFLQRLDNEFDLVMIHEYFDESLVH